MADIVPIPCQSNQAQPGKKINDTNCLLAKEKDRKKGGDYSFSP